FDGDAGNDTLDGGSGDDAYYYYDPGTGNFGNDTIVEAASTGFDLLHFGAFPTSVTVDLGSTSQQSIGNGLLNLTLSTSTSIDFVIGSNYDDAITCDNHGDLILSYGGNDTLVGGDGNDTLA